MDEGIFRDQTGLVFKETKGCTAGAAGGLSETLPGRDGIGYESFIIFLDQRPGDEGQGLHIGQRFAGHLDGNRPLDRADDNLGRD